MSRIRVAVAPVLRYLLLTMLAWSGASAQTVLNGDFEQGRGHGWTEYSAGGYAEIGTANFFASSEITPAVTPRSGSLMARLGGYSYEVNSISQSIQLPNATPLYLRFYTQSRSANTSECSGLWVGATVSLTINNQTISSTSLCQYNDLVDWTEYYVDMTAIAGQVANITFKAEAANSVWSFVYFDDVSIGSTTGVGDNLLAKTPDRFELLQNYPNPFNPSTQISYTVTKAGFVTINVYDILGRQLTRLVNERKAAGSYSVTWSGEAAPSGVYFYRMITAEGVVTKRMCLVK